MGTQDLAVALRRKKRLQKENQREEEEDGREKRRRVKKIKGQREWFYSGFLLPYHRSEVPDGRETGTRDEWESIWG